MLFRSADGSPGGLLVEALSAPGKLPIHLEGLTAPAPEDNIGLMIEDRGNGRRLAYFSAASAVTPAMQAAFNDADCVFFDGTFWSSDELVALGLGGKRAEDMAHLPVGGPGGSLHALAQVRAAKRIFIHVNNTNPLLRPRSPERKQAEARGWQVAYDGMELTL